MFVDQFGQSLRCCHLEFDEEVISDCLMAHSRILEGEVVNLGDFRELSFCGLCGPCFERCYENVYFKSYYFLIYYYGRRA